MTIVNDQRKIRRILTASCVEYSIGSSCYDIRVEQESGGPNGDITWLTIHGYNGDIMTRVNSIFVESINY